VRNMLGDPNEGCYLCGQLQVSTHYRHISHTGQDLRNRHSYRPVGPHLAVLMIPIDQIELIEFLKR
jgi:hypothetical protein